MDMIDMVRGVMAYREVKINGYTITEDQRGTYYATNEMGVIEFDGRAADVHAYATREEPTLADMADEMTRFNAVSHLDKELYHTLSDNLMIALVRKLSAKWNEPDRATVEKIIAEYKEVPLY